MKRSSVLIAGAARTPIGDFQGLFSTQSAVELGVVATRAAIERAAIQGSRIEELLFGCVLPAGLAQAPARQVALKAGLDAHTRCTTVNKICGSGMQAVLLAHDQIIAGSSRVTIAGGMENMTRAPYLLPAARRGMRLGHGEVLDHMLYDGLQDAYSGHLMGEVAQAVADRYGVTRQQMDDYAIASLKRTRQAMAEAYFQAEIAPVTVQDKTGEKHVFEDELPGTIDASKIPRLKPAFVADGSITAANSSAISDGAAALLLLAEEAASGLTGKPLARIVAHAGQALLPDDFSIAPVPAIQKVLQKAGWQVSDVDLFEINEAFALVPLLAIRELGLDPEKVNINGGACCLGHPIGASGARIIVTLLYALQRLGKSRGVASLCIGGGEATAIAVEML